MNSKTIVVAVVGTLLALLAGMEYVAERQWYAYEHAHPVEIADPGLPETRDIDGGEAAASPAFAR